VNESRGVATPVSTANVDYDSYLASARLVENVIPVGATWDGSDRPIPIHADATVPVTTAAGGGDRAARSGLPAASYLDPAQAATERERIFDRSWQFVCHASDLPAPGTAIRFGCAARSSVVMRGTDGACTVS
jgi:hypothetical protein